MKTRFMDLLSEACTDEPKTACPEQSCMHIGWMTREKSFFSSSCASVAALIAPRDRALDSRRISLVFFHQPNYDAMVSCLESCEGPGNPAKYAPVSSGDHLYMKFTKQTAQGRDAADVAEAACGAYGAKNGRGYGPGRVVVQGARLLVLVSCFVPSPDSSTATGLWR